MIKPTAEYIRSRLRYDANAGNLFWLQYEPMGRNWNAKFAGKKAGSVHGSRSAGRQRRRVMIDKQFYMETHIICLIVTGNWPAHTIDHIDRDPMNNALPNLREATAVEQCGNKGQRESKYGLRGVTKSGNKWRARIRIDGKDKCLGLFCTKEEAAEAYTSAALNKWGEFYSIPTRQPNEWLVARAT